MDSPTRLGHDEGFGDDKLLPRHRELVVSVVKELSGLKEAKDFYLPKEKRIELQIQQLTAELAALRAEELERERQEEERNKEVSLLDEGFREGED